MQEWKRLILNEYDLPTVSEEAFNGVWDCLSEDGRNEILSYTRAGYRLFIDLLKAILCWTMPDYFDPKPYVGPITSCAAFMCFGNKDYVGLVTKELHDAFDANTDSSIPDKTERYEMTKRVTNIVNSLSVQPVRAVLFGYNVRDYVPEEVDPNCPTDPYERIDWFVRWWDIYHGPECVLTFADKYACFSNFHPAVVCLDGAEYPTVENAFQAAKTLDVSERAKFVNVSPSAAKKMGRSVKLRSDWKQVKVNVMRQLLKQKFAMPCFRSVLQSTGDAYICEGTTWHDTCWGVCHCNKCQGKGENHMGHLLMELREE